MFFLCLIIFACFRRFLICVCSLISHPGFEFLFASFMGTSILSRTNFTPAYHYFLHWSFSHQLQLMVFPWSLSDSKYPQVSRTLLSIQAVLNNVIVWMVSTRPPTSKSSSPFSNPFVTVPKAPITIGIIVTFMFHSFFQFSSKVEILILLFIFSPAYYYYYLTPREFFPPALTHGLSQESEWLQVSSGLQLLLLKSLLLLLLNCSFTFGFYNNLSILLLLLIEK